MILSSLYFFILFALGSKMLNNNIDSLTCCLNIDISTMDHSEWKFITIVFHEPPNGSTELGSTEVYINGVLKGSAFIDRADSLSSQPLSFPTSVFRVAASCEVVCTPKTRDFRGESFL